MSYLDKSIHTIHDAILKGSIQPLDLVKEAIALAKADNNNAFEYIMEKEALEYASKLGEPEVDNPLWGIPFAIKDNFSTKDIPTTGSSNILNGYVPIFSSEVVRRLEEQGAIIIAKTTLDELAMGGTGTSGHKGITFNPWDPSHTHLVGGSSCGSAAAISAGIVPFAIGSDTGDSVRKPASNAALVGFKPTWGRISRFGLFPFATSMDHVAYFTRNVLDSALALNVLAGRDDKDSSSSYRPVEDYTSKIKDNLSGKKIAVVNQILGSIKNDVIVNEFSKSVEKLRECGATVDYVDIDENLLKAIYPTYIIISCAEATSNNANLDGIKFGPRYPADNYEGIMSNARTKGFSELIKRRFIIGSYSLLRENRAETFEKAQKCRRLIVNAVNGILEKYDAIYLPASPTTAPLFEGGKSDKLSNEYLIADNWMAIGNFAGLPSLTLPIGFENGLPFGANLTSKKFSEKELFGIAMAIENITGLANVVAKEEK